MRSLYTTLLMCLLLSGYGAACGAGSVANTAAVHPVSTAGMLKDKSAKQDSGNVHESDRKKIVRAAYNMLENKAGENLSTAGALDSILERARLESRIGWKPSDGIDKLAAIAKRKKAYHGTGRIKAGDIVLFHNIRDVNSNGKDDDWFCAAAVVVRSRGWRKVAVGKVGSMLKKIYLDPDDPHRRRLDNGTVVNSFLRKPSRCDHRFQMYLAGELLAGFIDIEELLDP